MTVHRMCEQGHRWETPPSEGIPETCPQCGARLRSLERLVEPPSDALAGIVELLPSLLTSMGDGLVVANQQGRFLFFNAAAERLLGRGAAPLPVDRWAEHFGIFHADTMERVATQDLPLVRAINGEDTTQMELFYRNDNVPEGVYASVTGRPLRDPQGKLQGGFIIMRNISRHKQTEQQLRETGMYLTALMRSLPDAIYFKDREHRYLAINDSLARQFGLKDPAEAVGKKAEDFFAPEYAAEVTREEDRVMAGAPLADRESYQVWADGRPPRWVSTTRLPLCNEQNQIVGTIGLTRDITEAREAAEKLRESEQRFHNLFESSPDAIFVESLEGVILNVNPRGCQLQGRTRDELLGMTIYQLTLPSFHDRVRKGFEELVNNVRTRIEGYSWHRDGTQIPVEISANHIDYGGKKALLLHVRDLTQRARTAEELRLSEERYYLAVQGSTDGLWDWDLRRNKVYFSPRWKQMLGYEDEEIRDDFSEWESRVHPDDLERARQTIQDYLSGKSPHYELEHRLRHKNGSYRWILARGALIRDHENNPVRMAGSHTDIHQRKADEERLRKAQQAAEAANKAKSQFLANVSHELRTPLGGIHGFTELLMDMATTEQQREHLRMVQGCTESLLALIGDLLDFSQADAGSLKLAAQPFDLRTELGKMLKSLSIHAAQKGLLLACRVDADVPGRWLADWPRLRQVLINLIGNGLKFTDRGEVILRAQSVPASPETPGKARVHFTVRDTGIGIPENMREAIFAPFVQVDGTSTRRFGGSGLGLSIARRLVHLMGGRIWLESELDRGSTFHLEIPVDAVGPRNQPIGDSLRTRRALVLEPQPTHLQILGENLEELGLRIHRALSREEAVQIASRNPLDVLLVPVEVLHECPDFLTRLRGSQPGLRVVQLRPLGHKAEELPPDIPCRVLGLPLMLEDLDEALRLLFDGVPRPTPGPEVPPPGAVGSRPLRVLLAEDTVVNQRLIRTLLEKQGHTVQVVDNGQAAVEQVRREIYDAVLMDMSMPILDGLDATRLIRQEQAHLPDRLPIIALTAHASDSHREACLNAGMDDFVTKPVDPRVLYRVLQALTNRLPPTAQETTS